MINTKAFQSELSMAEKIFFGFLAGVFIFTMALPQIVHASPVVAGQEPVVEIKGVNEPNLLTARFDEWQAKQVSLPKTNTQTSTVTSSTTPLGVREMYVSSTAYSSDVAQTDSTPCITADGFNVCANGQENVIAANFLPFGTKVQIPDLYGDRIFVVHDRMNARYYKKIDLWMTSRDRAIQYGVRTVKIRIVE
jgi:3D (Asp-Asp-Asp) domain-containing protein